VSKVDWASVEPVDILTGGFPARMCRLQGVGLGWVRVLGLVCGVSLLKQ
jgi:hypothetical protein